MMLPNGWKKVKLGDVASISSGSTPLRSNKAYFENGNMPWVKTMDLNNGKIIKTDECITELAAKKCKPYPAGTVLVAMYGGFNQIGRTGLLTFPASINQALAALQFEKDVYSEYVLFYLNANVERWRSCAASSRKDPNITSHDVEKFEIVLPPIEEQKKIAATLSVWDSAIEKMEKLIESKENKFNIALKQNVLEKGIALKWKEISLTEIIKSVTPPSKIHQDSYLNNGKYPIVDQSKDIIAGWTNDESSVLKINRPLIIFGDHTCALKIMHVSFAQGADGIKILSVKDGYDPVYIYYAIKANPVIPEGYKRHFSALMLKNIFCPSFDEQKKYAVYFKLFDDELSLLKQQLENYKMQKQGLLRKLLTGQWRVK